MEPIEERYISLLTDFGFKRIFGTEVNKELLISFLNSLFGGKEVIVDIKYLNSEHVGDAAAERKAIFDVYCENERGEKFIVEMQNAYLKFFKDRSVYYSTFPIREQATKGDAWEYDLKKVYTVALLNFNLNDDAFDSDSLRHDVKLCDTFTHKVFYDKLTLIYVEIAKFRKDESQLETDFDKWLYLLRNLSRLDGRPASLREKIFDRLFEQAEIAKFTLGELKSYEDSRKAYRDLRNSLNTAREEGREEGRAEGRAEARAEALSEGIEIGVVRTVRDFKAAGASIELIMKATGLSRSEIERL